MVFRVLNVDSLVGEEGTHTAFPFIAEPDPPKSYTTATSHIHFLSDPLRDFEFGAA